MFDRERVYIIVSRIGFELNVLSKVVKFRTRRWWGEGRVSPSSAAAAAAMARRAAGFHRLSTSCAKGPFVALIWSFFLLELILPCLGSAINRAEVEEKDKNGIKATKFFFFIHYYLFFFLARTYPPVVLRLIYLERGQATTV